jgi:peptidoglycan/LPS O-acetylase OafA/YrhL
MGLTGGQSQRMSTIRELKSLTGLRGIAAIYVVLVHYLFGMAMHGFGSTFIYHGYLGVEVLFVLSGFVITLNYAELFRGGFDLNCFQRFLGRRIARAYPLYFVTTLAAFLLVLTHILLMGHSASLSSMLFANLAMIQSWKSLHR